jgi:hypothetical protein
MAPDVPSIDSVQLSYAIAASLCPSNASGAAKPSGFSGDKGDCDHKAVGSGAGHSFEAGEKCDPHALLSLVTAQESVAGPGDQIDLQPPSTSHLLATFPGGFLDTSNSDMPSVLSSAQRTSSAMQAWQTVLQHLASSGLAGEPAGESVIACHHHVLYDSLASQMVRELEDCLFLPQKWATICLRHHVCQTLDLGSQSITDTAVFVVHDIARHCRRHSAALSIQVLAMEV